MRIHNRWTEMSTKFLEFISTSYYDNNDKLKVWNWIRRIGNKKAVVVVAQHENGRLVVTKEFRVPLNGYEYGFPAGLIDTGETPEEAAVRELKEETGFDVEEILSVSPAIYSSAGLTNESVHIVRCKVKGKSSQDGNEGSEDITTYLLDPTMTSVLLSEDRMFGAKAYIYMEQYVKTGHI